MKTYTVKEVARLMNTSEETVRRWIRSGKLNATMESKKEGRIITEAMLKEFVKNTPKYAPSYMNPVGGIINASAMLLGTFIASNIAKNEIIKNSEISSEEIEKILLEDMAKSKAIIKRKRATIEDMEKEILAEENKVKSIKYMLNEMKRKEKPDGTE